MYKLKKEKRVQSDSGLQIRVRTVNYFGSFEHPKHMFTLMDKKIIKNLRS